MKTALITGGTKGIGYAVCEKLCSEGWRVIITYLSDEINAKKVVSELQEFHKGAELIGMRVDCSRIESIDLINDFLGERDFKLDALIFNAGATDRSDFKDMNLLSWSAVFDSNLNVPVFLLQKLLGKLNENCSVIFTSSIMGAYPHSMSLSYGVSKAAVNSLVKNLVKFLAPKKIRVNAVAPGFVNTEWQKNKPIEIRSRIENKIALGRFCEPKELADAYWLLIENRYMNGEILTLDGGYSMK